MPRYENKQIIWWSTSEIIYWPWEQVEWLCQYMSLLQDGRYPVEPPTGYVDPGYKNNSASTPFAQASVIFSELTRRINRCGLDQVLVYDYYLKEKNYDSDSEKLLDISDRYDMPVEEVQKRINRVISYVASGTTPMWIDKPAKGDYQGRKGKTYREFIRRSAKSRILAEVG